MGTDMTGRTGIIRFDRHARWMVTSWVVLIAVVAVIVEPSSLRAQAPLLTGEVRVDPGTGRVTGDVCVSDTPAADTLRFLLHHGLNIRSIRDATGKVLDYGGHADLTPVGVALRYTIRDSLISPGTFCVRYTGAYPVYRDTLNTFDYQEVIAFNGRSLRAAPSTRWYPVPYDPVADRVYEDVRYDLIVQCDGCEAVYLNGSPPRTGPKARFSSIRPWPLLLLAGDFPVLEVDEAWFLGDSVGEPTARAFAGKVREITDFYEEFVGIPYPDTLVFLRVNPIKPMRPGQLWGFFVFPTLGTNVEFERFVEPGQEGEDAELNRLLGPYLWGLFAHETAHYYFGTLLPFRGPYAQFFGESAADYLALKAVERFAGAEVYRERLDRLYKRAVEGPPPTPLDEITSENQSRATATVTRTVRSYGFRSSKRSALVTCADSWPPSSARRKGRSPTTRTSANPP